MKDLFYNRKYCSYAWIVVFESQLKNACNAETEKQRTWKKYFNIWETELLCLSVLKSKSAYIQGTSVLVSMQMPSQSAYFTCMLCVYSLVLACKPFLPDIYDLWPFNFYPMKFMSWMNEAMRSMLQPQVKADLKQWLGNPLIMAT